MKDTQGYVVVILPTPSRTVSVDEVGEVIEVRTFFCSAFSTWLVQMNYRNRPTLPTFPTLTSRG